MKSYDMTSKLLVQKESALSGPVFGRSPHRGLYPIVGWEAEQRHLQIMNEVLQGLRNERNSRLVQKDQECEQKVQDAESKALAAINAAKERSEEIKARLATNQATYDNRIGELQAEANKLHNLKLDEERKRITKEFEASYAQTVEEAQQAIAAVRKQCEEQIAVEQARSIQVKAEFERYKVEMDEKINEAAAPKLTRPSGLPSNVKLKSMRQRGRTFSRSSWILRIWCPHILYRSMPHIQNKSS